MTPAVRRALVAAVATPTVGAIAVVALSVTAFAALAVSAEDRVEPATAFAACSESFGGSAAGLSTEQTSNAMVIVTVAAGRGLPAAGAVVGVMTAMTESSLINVAYGDNKGPDSRGLFQQRDSWGPISVRMDPAGAAGLFFDRLQIIADWQGLAPWEAAQQVQHSAFRDGSNYAAHYRPAVAVVAELVTGLDGGGGTAGLVDAGGEIDEGVDGFDLAAFCASGTGGVAAGAWGGFSNGLIPASALCPLTAVGQLLRCDAAQSWNAMATAYHTYSGAAMCITDSYRTLAAQTRLRTEKPSLAAAPGTSNHGWALAVDLCEPGHTGMGFTTLTYGWLKVYAAGYGFTHPGWAEPGRGQEEPWHWEYTGGAS